jgi:hypothetical protein
MKRRRRWVRRRNHQRIAAHPRRMKRHKGRAATLSGAGGPQGLGSKPGELWTLPAQSAPREEQAARLCPPPLVLPHGGQIFPAGLLINNTEDKCHHDRTSSFGRSH